MTPEELARRRNEFASFMSRTVQRVYRHVRKKCSMDGNKIPRPAAIKNFGAGMEDAVGVEEEMNATQWAAWGWRDWRVCQRYLEHLHEAG